MKRQSQAMSIGTWVLCTLIAVIPFASASDAEADEFEARLSAVEEQLNDPLTIQAYWKDSLRLETNNGRFKFKIGGRVHNDYMWGSAESDVEDFLGSKVEDSASFRRARLYISGTMYENILFKFQYDFAGGSVAFKDVYVGMSGLAAFGQIRIGQMKEPFGLEQLTSSNQITFMERALITALTAERSTGIRLDNTFADERGTWALGWFKGDTSDGNGGNVMEDGESALTARVTFLPWEDPEDRVLVHTGIAYRHHRTQDGLEIDTRPEVGKTDDFISTGMIADADDYGLYGVELAAVAGCFSVQGEYMMAHVDSAIGNDPDFSGYYVEGSWWVTGESRPYSHSSGAFKFTRPQKNFGDEDGFGAVQLAARYSMLDLDDAEIDGGKLSNVTLGVNWHLNPNVRVMANYVLAELENSTFPGNEVGDSDFFQIRLQLHF